MAISNHERVGRALNQFHKGVHGYFEREMQNKYGKNWPVRAAAYSDRTNSIQVLLKKDLYTLLKVMWGEWNNVFRETLGKSDRSLLSECQDIRNTWAHSNTFSTDDTYRALDSTSRFLSAISSPEAGDIDKQKQELLRLRFEDQARRANRRAAVAPTEGQPLATLKPWREITTPHPDVASGSYQQAEFAADLWQVYLDEGSDEYRDPTKFYERTYLTEGLKLLLMGALKRLSGKGGDPVIELQTNFGGGKTHAMLALYHMCLGVSAKDLPGIEPVLQETGIEELPQTVNTAILVGNKISPGQPLVKSDGTVVKTLWGEIAWQLGESAGGTKEAAKAFALVKESDETSTNPGDALKTVFNQYSPCLVLIDEWVAYARQLHDQNDLPGGSFDTQFTFAQTLSESAKNADRALLVASIPASDIEKGGDRGYEATERLKNAIGRVESPWRPASAEESFEIVRRRLFQSTTDTEAFKARDTVVKAFSEMYRTQSQEFPSECREANYERRLREAYPIHPELFDRLYSDWSSLEKFQRTRGVLRLMAKVIHSLWEREDRSLIIMPAHVPVDDPQVQSELTRYLEDNWIPILEKDVDGSNSLPLELDRRNPNLGRYSACRRVTRTIYMGSAPTLRAANRGLEDKHIKLGCAQPGESVATFGDALRRLTDQATYLYVDANKRYWISTQPNVTRTANDRADQISDDRYKIWDEITQRLKKDKARGEFSAIHIAPESTADVPDDSNLGVRLVVLDPQHPYSKKTEGNLAQQWIEEILHQKGSSPRYHKNTLTFLAPDKAKLENLEKNVAQFLAWDSIVRDKEGLNLDVAQSKQADAKRDEVNATVNTILSETYQWLLVPTQPNPQGDIIWEAARLGGQESPIERASRKLLHEEHLINVYSASRLCLEALDKYLWQDNNHINLKQLWEYLTQYLYLPRLKDSNVLLNAIRGGVNMVTWSDHFAYAEGWDENKGKYLQLQTGCAINPTISSQSLLVKPSTAQKQIALEQAVNHNDYTDGLSASSTNGDRSATVNSTEGEYDISNGSTTVIAEKPIKKRFYGSAEIDAMRINRDAGAIAQEVVQHLSSLNGANITISLEISATVPEGIPEEVIRTVSENCTTLKFNSQSFEIE